MDTKEYVDELEQAAAEDPAVGDGSPATAPHWAPFDDDLELDADGADGAADGDDDLDGEDDGDDTPIDDEI
jgi:hypothetical protein